MMSGYKYLPFRFKQWDKNAYLLVNETGEYLYLLKDEWKKFINGELKKTDEITEDLISKDFICYEYSPSLVNRIADKYRTRKRHIFDSASLHMLVLTNKCNQNCSYCHASSISDSVSENVMVEDMSIEIAKKSIDIAFQGKSEYLKFEFQGGEPTLNVSVLRESVRYAIKMNEIAKKTIEFVICTNLLELPVSIDELLSEYKINISTSLDGPEILHNYCRIDKNGNGTYNRVVSNITRIREHHDHNCVSALLTVTNFNLKSLNEVIEQYYRLGFQSIFIRQLNQFGRAEINFEALGYSITTFTDYYLSALSYIIDLNLQGKYIVEEYASIFLHKILTPFDPGFVDIQSPSGAGLSGIIYNTDGNVFVSDEGRMFFRTTRDKRFCLGNVLTHNQDELKASPILSQIVNASLLESLPGCAWCVYQPYCGTDPVKKLYGIHL